MPEPTLFDAISTAIESDGTDLGGPGAAPDEDTTPPGGDSGVDDSGLLEEGDDQAAPDGDEGDDQEGEPGGEDSEGGEREGEGAEGQPRGADGKFAKQGDKPGEQKPGEQKPPKVDHVNDPIPKDLKPATQERMRFLVNETKKLDTELQEVRGNFEQIVGGLRATGTTPEQYGEVLSFMGLFNSGDAAQQGKALEILEQMADRLATHLGKERTVGDPLAAHADLKADVQAGKLSIAYAKEIARQRNQAKFQSEMRANAQRDQDAQRAHADAVEEARVSLNTLEESLADTDPQYAKIKAAILPVLKTVLPSLPPAQWTAKFKEAYKNAKARMQPRVRPSNPGNQPMRGGRAAGGGGAGTGADGMSSGGPASMFDAVSAAIARAGK
jgi:hypothetical protein